MEIKKEFIFPRKAFEMIVSRADEESKLAAMSHAVQYGLGAAEPEEKYTELERLIDRANSCDRRVRPTLEDYSEIIGHLNEKCGAKYHVNSRKTKEMISARFGEGFTREDFFAMIDFKCEEWLNNEKMRGYLRPETLFGVKFEGYLNQARMAKGKTTQKTESSFDTDEFFAAAMKRSYQ